MSTDAREEGKNLSRTTRQELSIRIGNWQRQREKLDQAARDEDGRDGR